MVPSRHLLPVFFCLRVSEVFRAYSVHSNSTRKIILKGQPSAAYIGVPTSYPLKVQPLSFLGAKLVPFPRVEISASNFTVFSPSLLIYLLPLLRTAPDKLPASRSLTQPLLSRNPILTATRKNTLGTDSSWQRGREGFSAVSLF